MNTSTFEQLKKKIESCDLSGFKGLTYDHDILGEKIALLNYCFRLPGRSKFLECIIDSIIENEEIPSTYPLNYVYWEPMNAPNNILTEYLPFLLDGKYIKADVLVRTMVIHGGTFPKCTDIEYCVGRAKNKNIVTGNDFSDVVRNKGYTRALIIGAVTEQRYFKNLYLYKQNVLSHVHIQQIFEDMMDYGFHCKSDPLYVQLWQVLERYHPVFCQPRLHAGELRVLKGYLRVSGPICAIFNYCILTTIELLARKSPETGEGVLNFFLQAIPRHFCRHVNFCINNPMPIYDTLELGLSKSCREEIIRFACRTYRGPKNISPEDIESGANMHPLTYIFHHGTVENFELALKFSSYRDFDPSQKMFVNYRVSWTKLCIFAEHYIGDPEFQFQSTVRAVIGISVDIDPIRVTAGMNLDDYHSLFHTRLYRRIPGLSAFIDIPTVEYRLLGVPRNLWPVGQGAKINFLDDYCTEFVKECLVYTPDGYEFRCHVSPYIVGECLAFVVFYCYPGFVLSQDAIALLTGGCVDEKKCLRTTEILNLHKLKDLDPDDLKSCNLEFSINDGEQIVSLSKKHQTVDSENLVEYITAYENYRLSKTMARISFTRQVGTVFINTIRKAFPYTEKEMFERLFNHALIEKIFGHGTIDIQYWQNITAYMRCNDLTQQVKWFWKFVMESPENAKNVLKFTTGTGFMVNNKVNPFRFTICLSHNHGLPTAQTCTATITIPYILDEQKFMDNMKLAMQNPSEMQNV